MGEPIKLSLRARRRRACSSSLDSASLAGVSRVRCMALVRCGARAVPKLLARTTFTDSTAIPWLCSARVKEARSRPSAASAPASAALIVTRMAPALRSTSKAISPKSPPSTRTIMRFSSLFSASPAAALGPFAAPDSVKRPPLVGVRSPAPECQAPASGSTGALLTLSASADNCAPTSVAQRSACSSVVFSSSARSCARDPAPEPSPVAKPSLILFISAVFASICEKALCGELVFQASRSAFLLNALFCVDARGEHFDLLQVGAGGHDVCARLLRAETCFDGLGLGDLRQRVAALEPLVGSDPVVRAERRFRHFQACFGGAQRLEPLLLCGQTRGFLAIFLLVQLGDALIELFTTVLNDLLDSLTSGTHERRPRSRIWASIVNLRRASSMVEASVTFCLRNASM